MATMKATAVIALVFLVASLAVIPSLSALLQGNWTAKAPMLTDRYDLGAAVVNGRIYAIGGRDSLSKPGDPFQYTYAGINEEYNPATDTWTTKAPMPTPLQDFGIAVYDDKIYCLGGTTIEVCNPANDTWEIKASMPHPRTQFEANMVDGKIYIMGGRTGGQYTSVTTNEAYDPATGEWTMKAPMLYPVVEHSSAVVGNKIYVMGGQNEFKVNDTMMMPYNQIYDTETDTWSLGAALPNSVWGAAGAAAGALDSEIYLVGGQLDKMYDGTDLLQIYNPATDNWTIGAHMPTARFDLAVAVLGDKLYALGGTDGYLFPGETSLRNNEVYAVNERTTSPPEPKSQVDSLAIGLLIGGVAAAASTVIIALAVARKRARTAQLGGTTRCCWLAVVT